MAVLRSAQTLRDLTTATVNVVINWWAPQNVKVIWLAIGCSVWVQRAESSLVALSLFCQMQTNALYYQMDSATRCVSILMDLTTVTAGMDIASMDPPSAMVHTTTAYQITHF